MRDLTNALQHALINGAIRDAVPSTYSVRYDEYGRKTVTLAKPALNKPMPERRLTIQTRHTRGAALNKGGLPPVARNPNKVYERAAISGFRYPGINKKFGDLSGFYRDKEAAGGQGVAIRELL